LQKHYLVRCWIRCANIWEQHHVSPNMSASITRRFYWILLWKPRMITCTPRRGFPSWLLKFSRSPLFPYDALTFKETYDMIQEYFCAESWLYSTVCEAQIDKQARAYSRLYIEDRRPNLFRDAVIEFLGFLVVHC
jgi:hypothetical protein